MRTTGGPARRTPVAMDLVLPVVVLVAVLVAVLVVGFLLGRAAAGQRVPVRVQVATAAVSSGQQARTAEVGGADE